MVEASEQEKVDKYTLTAQNVVVLKTKILTLYGNIFNFNLINSYLVEQICLNS